MLTRSNYLAEIRAEYSSLRDFAYTSCDRSKPNGKKSSIEGYVPTDDDTISLKYLGYTPEYCESRKLVLDLSPSAVEEAVKGMDQTLEAIKKAKDELGVEIVLVGEKEAVEQELARHSRTSAVEVVPACQVVTMHESPSSALRKKDSSMKVAFEMMKRGEVEAVVSARSSPSRASNSSINALGLGVVVINIRVGISGSLRRMPN